MVRTLCLFLLLPVIAIAQSQIPSDSDLKTSYCLAPIKLMAEASEKTLSLITTGSVQHGQLVRYIQQTKDNLNRAHMFLLSKRPYLDSTALTFAQKRGESDVASAFADMLQCVGACGSFERAEKESTVGLYMSCAKQCDGGPAGKRMAECEELDWLPY